MSIQLFVVEQRRSETRPDTISFGNADFRSIGELQKLSEVVERVGKPPETCFDVSSSSIRGAAEPRSIPIIFDFVMVQRVLKLEQKFFLQ